MMRKGLLVWIGSANAVALAACACAGAGFWGCSDTTTSDPGTVGDTTPDASYQTPGYDGSTGFPVDYDASTPVDSAVPPDAVAPDDATADGGTDGNTSGDSGPSDAGSDARATADASDGAAPDAATTPDAAVPTPGYYFDRDLNGFVGGYSQPSSVGTSTTITWDSLVGQPTSGSLAAVVPFTAGNQKMTFSKYLPAPINLSGKTLHVFVKLDSGVRASSPFAYAKLYVKTTHASGDASVSNIYGDSGAQALDPAKGWIELTLKADAPGGYVENNFDATATTEMGVELDSPYDNAVAAAGTVHIDSFYWQ